jgi:periplasmic protein TonB
MRSRALFFTAAIFIHLGILLFGGLLFLKPPEEEGATEIAEVDIISDDSAQDEKKKDEELVKKESEEAAAEEAMEAQDEAPPDMAELEAIQLDAAAAVPELQALSLNALEGALAPGMTAGDFGWGVSLGSGGRIGGTGSAVDAELAAAGGIFDAADLDQKPRTLFQVPPLYPAELRRKKAAGTVYVLFVVDQQGRVQDPKIESSPDAAFERPVIDAVKRWRFEPGSRNGQKVQCKMRLPIRFSAES